MATEVSSVAVSVSTTATQIIGTSATRTSGAIKVPTGGVAVFIGGATVTTANGFPLYAGETMTLSPSYPSDPLGTKAVFGIVATGTQDVRILSGGDD